MYFRDVLYSIYFDIYYIRDWIKFKEVSIFVKVMLNNDEQDYICNEVYFFKDNFGFFWKIIKLFIFFKE